MLETKIPPPLVALGLGGAMWAVARLAPAIEYDHLWRVAITGVLGFVGLAMTVLGFAAFGKARTTIDPVHPERASSLVTGGVFGYTRNPMYVGLALVLSAWCVHLSVPWTLAGPVAFVVFITRFQIIPEERVMRAKFGRLYSEYQATVRRWL